MTVRRRRWGTFVAVGAVALLVNLPWFYALAVSFKSDGDLSGNPLDPRFVPTLTHYANALGAAGYDFPRFFLNSILIALLLILLILVHLCLKIKEATDICLSATAPGLCWGIVAESFARV